MSRKPTEVRLICWKADRARELGGRVGEGRVCSSMRDLSTRQPSSPRQETTRCGGDRSWEASRSGTRFRGRAANQGRFADACHWSLSTAPKTQIKRTREVLPDAVFVSRTQMAAGDDGGRQESSGESCRPLVGLCRLLGHTAAEEARHQGRDQRRPGQRPGRLRKHPRPTSRMRSSITHTSSPRCRGDPVVPGLLAVSTRHPPHGRDRRRRPPVDLLAEEGLGHRHRRDPEPVRSIGLAAGIVDFKICAIDATWSGLCFTRRKK